MFIMLIISISVKSSIHMTSYKLTAVIKNIAKPKQ